MSKRSTVGSRRGWAMGACMVGSRRMGRMRMGSRREIDSRRTGSMQAMGSRGMGSRVIWDVRGRWKVGGRSYIYMGSRK